MGIFLETALVVSVRDNLSVLPFYIKENPNPAAQDWGSVREVVYVYCGVKFW